MLTGHGCIFLLALILHVYTFCVQAYVHCSQASAHQQSNVGSEAWFATDTKTGLSFDPCLTYLKNVTLED